MQFDLKALTTVLGELEEERGVTKEKVLEAIEFALATAYKKEYGKRDQVVRARFDINTGTTEFEQIKTIVDDTTVRFKEDVGDEAVAETDESQTKKILAATGDAPTSSDVVEDEIKLPLFNTEKHMLLDDAKKIKKGAQVGDEIVFPLEMHDDFGRIAAQTAKQVIIQKIREAEKEHLSHEYGEREGEILAGTVQRVERGNVFVDLGRAVGILPYDEQIPGERFRAGERIRAYLFKVEETPRGVFLRMSRSHPQFLVRLFEAESPEVAQGIVEIKAIAREPGSRSKVAVFSNDEHIDPVGSLVGQRGVRVSTVMSELAGEKIDVIEWSETPEHFIEDALSPAKVLSVEITDEEAHSAIVRVTEDQQSLAIGRGGQNVRLAAKLTGWRIDIQSAGTDEAGVAPEETRSSEVVTPENETPVTPDSDAAPETQPETTKDSDETPTQETENSPSEKGE
ncbi:transcription termination/antitermination protein NusA [Candidatus Campbellbacteria bacterium]|nr:MAG: transcription termination/antitermination protein NusA [Candidatus Campbellbacteria bacterium]